MSASITHDGPEWHGFLEVDGTAVHTVSWGGVPERGGGEPRRLLLLHGLGGSTIHWQLVGAALADRLGAIVTAIDLAGFGRTRARAESASIGANSDLVTSLLERYGSAEVVGNSMGGAIALIVAARRPDLVSRLVLVTPTLPQPRWPYPPVAVLPHNWPAAVPGFGVLAIKHYAAAASDEQVVDDRLHRSFFDLRRIDQGIRQQMVELVKERRSFHEAAHAYAAAARSLFWYLASAGGIARDIARVPRPTLIIHGEHDRLVPLLLAMAARDERPDWNLEVVLDCGHLPQLELPAEFIAAFGADA
jgi:pimeloyl-ACP methyl ester carboxylesterase